jgi:hypothetical protein
MGLMWQQARSHCACARGGHRSMTHIKACKYRSCCAKLTAQGGGARVCTWLLEFCSADSITVHCPCLATMCEPVTWHLGFVMVCMSVRCCRTAHYCTGSQAGCWLHCTAGCCELLSHRNPASRPASKRQWPHSNLFVCARGLATGESRRSWGSAWSDRGAFVLHSTWWQQCTLHAVVPFRARVSCAA